jgi:hypothetical protein
MRAKCSRAGGSSLTAHRGMLVVLKVDLELLIADGSTSRESTWLVPKLRGRGGKGPHKSSADDIGVT